jgi:hypoxanthine phosphoribosyltransferase
MISHPDLDSILLPREQIARRVAELGRRISEDYKGRDLVLVGVLKGSVIFLADLMRAISIPHRFDLIRAASYGDEATSSGHVAISRHLELPLVGCDVLLVEDILDTGLTLETLRQEFKGFGAHSIEVCVFLSKQRERVAAIQPRYVGFEIPDVFVVGYGLDYDERFRHFDCVAVLKPEAYRGAQNELSQ